MQYVTALRGKKGEESGGGRRGGVRWGGVGRRGEVGRRDGE